MEQILRKVHLFSGLNDREMDGVAKRLKRHAYAAGATIIQEDEPSSRLFVLLEGTVRVTASLTDRKDSYAILNPGDHFGEISLIDGLAPSATVVAEEPAVALSISREDLHEIIEQDPALGATMLMSMLREFCRRLRETDQSLSFTRLMMRERDA